MVARRSCWSRIPLKKMDGHLYNDLYNKHKGKFGRDKYTFVRKGHEYFGIHNECMIFGKRMHVYVYMDNHNTLTGGSTIHDRAGMEFNAMKDYEKVWMMVVKCSFFHTGLEQRDDCARGP